MSTESEDLWWLSSDNYELNDSQQRSQSTEFYSAEDTGDVQTIMKYDFQFYKWVFWHLKSFKPLKKNQMGFCHKPQKIG